METQDDISLKSYNTFGIDVKAKRFISVNSVMDLKNIFSSEEFPEKFLRGRAFVDTTEKPNLRGRAFVEPSGKPDLRSFLHQKSFATSIKNQSGRPRGGLGEALGRVSDLGRYLGMLGKVFGESLGCYWEPFGDFGEP